MTTLVIIFLICIGVPTIAALVVSWRDAMTKRLPTSRHAPRGQRRRATIIVYHTTDTATSASLRHLARIKAVTLSIIVVVPAETTYGGPAGPNVHIHHKQRPTSRAVTIASCFSLLPPDEVVGVIDGGDILTAPAIHTALATFRRTPQLEQLVFRQTRPMAATFLDTMTWLSTAARHIRTTITGESSSRMPSGSWLRAGRLIHGAHPAQRRYMPSIVITSPYAQRLPHVGVSGILVASGILITASICYTAAARLQTALPLIAFWIITAWWLNVLISLAPARFSHKLTPALIAPLAGIVLPVWCLLLVCTALLGAWERFTRTRRQHPDHGALFSLRHPQAILRLHSNLSSDILASKQLIGR